MAREASRSRGRPRLEYDPASPWACSTSSRASSWTPRLLRRPRGGRHHHHHPGRGGEVGTQVLDLADALRHGVLRHRVHGASRPRTTTWRASAPRCCASRRARPTSCSWPARSSTSRARSSRPSTTRCPSPSGSSPWASAPRRGGFYRSLPRHAGDRRDHPGRRVRARLPALARGADRRHHEDPGADPEGRAGQGARRARTGSARPGDGAIDRRAAPRRLGEGRRRSSSSRASRRAACAVPRPEQHGRTSRRTMASTTEIAPPPTPPAGDNSPAVRVLTEQLGDEGPARRRLARRPLDHGRRASAWVEAGTPAARSPRARLQALPRPLRRRLPRRERRAERFEVVLPRLLGLQEAPRPPQDRGARERTPAIDTITGVYKGANWFEREAWDLYGIVFKGHPNLVRILTHEDFVGHPMRKDYPTAQRHVLKEPKELAAQACPTGSSTCVVNIGPVASRHARHLPRAGRSWTARRSWTPRPRSATCTATSRRWRRSGRTGRSSRTPTG